MPAGLFGLKNSNKDFSQKKAWGKNEFNSAFPAALCCYLDDKNIKANYLTLDNEYNECIVITEKNIKDIFSISPDQAFFAFEAIHSPYQKWVTGKLPRVDLVIQKDGQCLAGLEVKLTALPDNTTCYLSEEQYGSELVVRPDSIVYLACSLASAYGDGLSKYLPIIKITDWLEPAQVLEKIPEIISAIASLTKNCKQDTPFLLQPVWKTLGKQAELADHCFDVFCWSDTAFAYFMTKIADNKTISRPTRAVIWLYKMLLDIILDGRFNPKNIIDKLSYNTKNDKAFSVSGAVTHRYMQCQRLAHPIIQKTEIKNIILGGGEKLLSPERRLDAVLVASPHLFL